MVGSAPVETEELTDCGVSRFGAVALLTSQPARTRA